MLSNGELDWQHLCDLIEFHIEQGTDGIVAVGQPVSLDSYCGCCCQILKKVVQQVNGRIPVIAGTGGNSTQEAVHLTAEAKALGADACLLVTPYYIVNWEGLFRHFETVARMLPFPRFSITCQPPVLIAMIRLIVWPELIILLASKMPRVI